MEEAKNKENKQPEKTDEKDKDKEKGQQSSGKDKEKKEEQELVSWGVLLIQTCANLRYRRQRCYFALVTAALTTWLSRPKSLPLKKDDWQTLINFNIISYIKDARFDLLKFAVFNSRIDELVQLAYISLA